MQLIPLGCSISRHNQRHSQQQYLQQEQLQPQWPGSTRFVSSPTGGGPTSITDANPCRVYVWGYLSYQIIRWYYAKLFRQTLPGKKEIAEETRLFVDDPSTGKDRRGVVVEA